MRRPTDDRRPTTADRGSPESTSRVFAADRPEGVHRGTPSPGRPGPGSLDNGQSLENHPRIIHVYPNGTSELTRIRIRGLLFVDGPEKPAAWEAAMNCRDGNNHEKHEPHEHYRTKNLVRVFRVVRG